MRGTLYLLYVLGPGLLGGGCRGDFSTEPPLHVNPNMDNQERFDPQEPSPFFRDGLAMRRPVEGTVARGQLRTDRHLHLGRAPGGFALAPPAALPVTEAFLARGRERFGVYCGPCHGPLGRGDGVVFRRNAGLPRPASFHEPRLGAMPLGEIVHTVARGKQNMQALGPQIPAPDRWAIAAYLRALQISQHPPSDLERRARP